MIGKFNLYDFIAVVIPGMLSLWAISFFSEQVGLKINIPFSGGITETSVLIGLSYVTGLLLQGLSQGITEKALLWLWDGFPSAKWLLPEDTRLSTEYKQRIFQSVQQKYGLSINEQVEKLSSNQKKKVILQRNQEIFYLCYNAVEKLSDRPHIFNAQYGLFRCLLTSFSVLFIICLLILFFGNPNNKALVLYLISFLSIGAIVSYFRTKKRGEDFAKSVFDLFLTNYCENK